VLFAAAGYVTLEVKDRNERNGFTVLRV